MEMILDKMTELICRNEDIDDEEKEVIRYGLEIVVTRAIFAVIICVMGLLMNCFIESIIFTVSFTMLRQYGGGYHADTRRSCFVLSILTLVIALGMIKLSMQYFTIMLLVAVFSVISAIYIFAAAPIDTHNRRFDDDEIKIYGRKAKILTVALAAVTGILWLFSFYGYASTVATGIIIEAYLMLAGKIKNIRNGETV